MKKHRAEYAKKWRKRNGAKPAGSIAKCVDCGDEFARTSGPNNRCKSCRKSIKKTTNDVWRENNKDKIKIISKRATDKYYFDGMRYRALERDKFTCQNCGTCCDLHVHHIDESGRGRANNSDINNSLSNLLTLCRGCHRKEHVRLAKEQKNHLLSE